MKVLAVETATAWQSVAILDGEQILARNEQEAAGSHSKFLLPAIDRLFVETGLVPARLDGLVVSGGPGSFTGLRVGLSTLLGVRTVTQLPLAVVPTLEGMAWNLRGTFTPLCPVLNSRRGELYWAFFKWTSRDCLVRLIPEQVGAPATLGRQVGASVLLYGEGWETEQAAIRAAIGSKDHVLVAAEHSKPSAVSIGLAGIIRLQRGERAGLGASPLYIQRPEAELRYEQSGGISPVARRREKVARKLKNRLTVAMTRRRKA